MKAAESTITIEPPALLQGQLTLPGDKSISHRAAIVNSLSTGKARILNFAPGQDCMATVTCLRALGIRARKTRSDDSPTLSIHGNSDRGLSEAVDVLDARDSATTMRLLGGLLSARPFLSVITGNASLRSRPMGRLIEPLRLMGADISGRGGDAFAPLVIRGKQLHGIEFALPVPSAQIKSAILLAGLFARGNTVLHQPSSSRDHTERMLGMAGARLESDANSISLCPLDRPLAPINFRVPGDISSGAYFLVAAAVHPDAKIVLKDCGVNPTRTGIIDALLAMGARLRILNKRMEAGEPLADIVVESSDLKGIEIGGDIIPRLIDEIPALAVAGCFASGRTVIRNAAELRLKESDRIATVSRELSCLGARIETLPDGMIIHGGKTLSGTEVSSHLDHRLAMSLGVAALIARGKTTIRYAHATQVSYPAFWRHIRQLSSNRDDSSGFGQEAIWV